LPSDALARLIMSQNVLMAGALPQIQVCPLLYCTPLAGFERPLRGSEGERKGLIGREWRGRYEG